MKKIVSSLTILLYLTSPHTSLAMERERSVSSSASIMGDLKRDEKEVSLGNPNAKGQVLEEKIQLSMEERLPNEVKELIFTYLDDKSLFLVSQACHGFLHVVDGIFLKKAKQNGYVPILGVQKSGHFKYRGDNVIHVPQGQYRRYYIAHEAFNQAWNTFIKNVRSAINTSPQSPNYSLESKRLLSRCAKAMNVCYPNSPGAHFITHLCSIILTDKAYTKFSQGDIDKVVEEHFLYRCYTPLEDIFSEGIPLWQLNSLMTMAPTVNDLTQGFNISTAINTKINDIIKIGIPYEGPPYHFVILQNKLREWRDTILKNPPAPLIKKIRAWCNLTLYDTNLSFTDLVLAAFTYHFAYAQTKNAEYIYQALPLHEAILQGSRRSIADIRNCELCFYAAYELSLDIQQKRIYIDRCIALNEEALQHPSKDIVDIRNSAICYDSACDLSVDPQQKRAYNKRAMKLWEEVLQDPNKTPIDMEKYKLSRSKSCVLLLEHY